LLAKRGKSPWAVQNRLAGVVATWAIFVILDPADVWDAARRPRVLRRCETPIAGKIAAKSLPGKELRFGAPGPVQKSQNCATFPSNVADLFGVAVLLNPFESRPNSPRAENVLARSGSATRKRHKSVPRGVMGLGFQGASPFTECEHAHIVANGAAKSKQEVEKPRISRRSAGF
jgi:hypothetical protein